MNAKIVTQSSIPSDALRKMVLKARRTELTQTADLLRAASVRARMAGKPALQMRIEALMREAMLELDRT